MINKINHQIQYDPDTDRSIRKSALWFYSNLATELEAELTIHEPIQGIQIGDYILV
jgi:hypothetical protein